MENTSSRCASVLKMNKFIWCFPGRYTIFRDKQVCFSGRYLNCCQIKTPSLSNPVKHHENEPILVCINVGSIILLLLYIYMNWSQSIEGGIITNHPYETTHSPDLLSWFQQQSTNRSSRPIVTQQQSTNRPSRPIVTQQQSLSELPPYQITNSFSYTIKCRKECTICMSRKTKRRMRCCGQVICQTCILGWHSTNNRTCPFCRKSYE